MFKSKHSGWTWDLKRTPFGGGGGFISDIGDALASVDPGPAIGSGLASVDKTVNDNIPGGWITVGGLAAGGLAIAYAPEIMAYAAEMGIEPAAASAELGVPGVNAATGEAVASGTGLTGGAGGSTGLLAGGTTGGLTIPGGAAIAVDPAIAAGTGAGIGSAGAAGLGTVGTLSAGLPAAGAPAGTSIGMSGALAPGTVMGTGAAGGGAIGSSYAVGANGLPATDFFGNYIPASSVNIGGVPDTIAGIQSSISTNDINNARKLAQSLMGNSLAGAAQNMAVGQNGVASAIPGIVRGNQTPFAYTAQQPIRNATTPDLAQLATLLKQV